MHLSDNHGTSSVLEPAYSVVRATALQDQTSHSYLVVLLVVAAGGLWWLQFYSFCLCGECERLYDVAAPVLSGVNHLHYEQANGLRSREGGGGREKTVKLLITSLQPVFMSCLEIKEVFSKLCFHMSVGTWHSQLPGTTDQLDQRGRKEIEAVLLIGA